MGVSDHYSGGRVERMVVTIITVDPANERIEGIGRDGGVIPISAGHIGGFFRMPFEREQWTVVRENGIWTLESVIELSEWTKKRASLQMGEGLFTGTSLYNSGGQRFATLADIPPPGGGDSMGFYEQPNEPAGAQVGDVWIDTDAAPNLYTPPSSVISTLPASGYEGQEIYLQNAHMADYNAIWHMRYNATEHRWDWLGGTPFRQIASSTFNGGATGGSWQHIGFVGAENEMRPPGVDQASGNLGGLYEFTLSGYFAQNSNPNTAILLVRQSTGGTNRDNWQHGLVSEDSSTYKSYTMIGERNCVPTGGEATRFAIFNTANGGSVIFWATACILRIRPFYLYAP